jgi:hypothetical protein
VRARRHHAIAKLRQRTRAPASQVLANSCSAVEYASPKMGW